MIAIQVFVLVMLVIVQGHALPMFTPASGVIVPANGAAPTDPSQLRVHAPPGAPPILGQVHAPPGTPAILGQVHAPPGPPAILGPSVILPEVTPVVLVLPEVSPGVPALPVMTPAPPALPTMTPGVAIMPTTLAVPVQPIMIPGVPALIPNNCSVEVLAGNGCRTFGNQRCGPGTMYDIKYCVCNHNRLVNPATCSSK